MCYMYLDFKEFEKRMCAPVLYVCVGDLEREARVVTMEARDAEREQASAGS